MRQMLFAIAQHSDVVGMDVVEINPMLDVRANNTSLLGAQLAIELVGRVVEQPAYLARAGGRQPAGPAQPGRTVRSPGTAGASAAGPSALRNCMEPGTGCGDSPVIPAPSQRSCRDRSGPVARPRWPRYRTARPVRARGELRCRDKAAQPRADRHGVPRPSS
jgi:hypothetical protein